jgi:hypothetical protein
LGGALPERIPARLRGPEPLTWAGDSHLHLPRPGAAADASFLAEFWTEIYLCGVCSCQEILRRNGRGQPRLDGLLNFAKETEV